jgi:replicative DNA helicase
MAYRAQNQKKSDPAQPPQAIDAEQAVLGAILKDEQAINDVVEIFEEEAHFYAPKHRNIFRAMLDLYNRSEPCDITMVIDELSKRGELESVGGRGYLVDLIEGVITTGNVASHAKVVLDRSLMRQLIGTSTEISRSCYSQEAPVDELLDQAEANIFSISESRLRRGFLPMKQLVKSTFEVVQQFDQDGGLAQGVLTGFTQLDEMTLGLQRGDLIIVAGRPSMGKTALALSMAQMIAMGDVGRGQKPTGVGIFSVEMSQEQLGMRMLCSHAKVNQHKLRLGKLSDKDHSRLSRLGGQLAETELFIDDSPTLSSLEMRAKARRLKARHDVGLIIVDYIQLMHASGRHENRQQEIASISRSLKALAKELDIPVIAISQLSRQVEQRGGEKRPQLSDLRESGAIEQDADVVMFVYRPEFYLSHLDKQDPKFVEVSGKAEIIVAKQRNGPTGVVRLTFLKELARFENLAPEYREIPPDVDPVDSSSGEVPF